MKYFLLRTQAQAKRLISTNIIPKSNRFWRYSNNAALEASLEKEGIALESEFYLDAGGELHHSDRGSQYASHAFQDKLKEFGMTCSMSRNGNCWDNAPTESWFNSFKNERYHGLRYATHAEMKAASFEYIEVFYNRKR